MEPLPVVSPLLSTYQAAEYLGVPRQRLAQWRCAKPPKGPAFIVVGRFVKYKRTDLDSWIDAQRVATQPPFPPVPLPPQGVPPLPRHLTWLPDLSESR
ncbi:MAG: helix-turn-helix domain-containing protein [Bifidobacteriaceae bacterium]|jgi:hypothetical protein|nr:helix-turn-helix domain-containing protein [Bifidobacteriaceae bacterium]